MTTTAESAEVVDQKLGLLTRHWKHCSTECHIACIQCNRDKLALAARCVLERVFQLDEKVAKISDQIPAASKLNVTIRVGGRVRGSMSGDGASLIEQLESAVIRAARDIRFGGPLTRGEVGAADLEIWYQTAAELIPHSSREDCGNRWFGIAGVEVKFGSKSAYYKPSVALTSQFASATDLFEALCKKAALAPGTWRDADCFLWKTSWVHICCPSSGAPYILRGLRLPRENVTVTANSLLDWTNRSASYLFWSQHEDGSFCYEYDPLNDTVSNNEANPVRASGCAYAMAEAASSDKLQSPVAYEKSALSAIAGILSRSRDLGDCSTYIADHYKSPEGKLGGSALLALALQSSLFRNRFARERSELIRGIRFNQLTDGSFRCTFGGGRDSKSQINFFPGQALLSLVMESSLGDRDCEESYKRAFGFYRNYFRRCPTTAFVGWQADVWSRAASSTRNEEYAAFVYEQVDWLLRLQISQPATSRYLGGFSRNENSPNYSSIVFLEAVGRACLTARSFGDEARAARYKEKFTLGLPFCISLGIASENCIFSPNYTRAKGGVTKSLTNFTVRSDFAQHAITLGLLTLDNTYLYD